MSPTFLLRACALLAILNVLAACNRAPPPPKTYPVRGNVVFKDGGSPTNGTIEFRAVADSMSALGQIQPDGSFSLATLADNAKLVGAVEGEHRVTFMPAPAPGEIQSTALPVTLTDSLKVRRDADNQFTIKIDRPKSP